FEGLDLAPLFFVTSIKMRLGRAAIGPFQDVGRVAEHAFVRDEDGCRAFAAGAADGGGVEDGQVGRLAIGDLCALEGPACFFAVVAEGDGDEQRRGHGPSCHRGLTMSTRALLPGGAFAYDAAYG